MDLIKKFSGQYILICMFVISLICTLIIGIIVQFQNIRDYKEQITTLKSELNNTKDEIKSIKNNTYNNDELENLARNKLGMVKENEIIYLEK